MVNSEASSSGGSVVAAQTPSGNLTASELSPANLTDQGAQGRTAKRVMPKRNKGVHESTDVNSRSNPMSNQLPPTVKTNPIPPPTPPQDEDLVTPGDSPLRESNDDGDEPMQEQPVVSPERLHRSSIHSVEDFLEIKALARQATARQALQAQQALQTQPVSQTSGTTQGTHANDSAEAIIKHVITSRDQAKEAPVQATISCFKHLSEKDFPKPEATKKEDDKATVTAWLPYLNAMGLKQGVFPKIHVQGKQPQNKEAGDEKKKPTSWAFIIYTLIAVSPEGRLTQNQIYNLALAWNPNFNANNSTCRHQLTIMQEFRKIMKPSTKYRGKDEPTGYWRLANVYEGPKAKAIRTETKETETNDSETNETKPQGRRSSRNKPIPKYEAEEVGEDEEHDQDKVKKEGIVESLTLPDSRNFTVPATRKAAKSASSSRSNATPRIPLPSLSAATASGSSSRSNVAPTTPSPSSSAATASGSNLGGNSAPRTPLPASSALIASTSQGYQGFIPINKPAPSQTVATRTSSRKRKRNPKYDDSETSRQAPLRRNRFTPPALPARSLTPQRNANVFPLDPDRLFGEVPRGVPSPKRRRYGDTSDETDEDISESGNGAKRRKQDNEWANASLAQRSEGPIEAKNHPSNSYGTEASILAAKTALRLYEARYECEERMVESEAEAEEERRRLRPFAIADDWEPRPIKGEPFATITRSASEKKVIEPYKKQTTGKNGESSTRPDSRRRHSKPTRSWRDSMMLDRVNGMALPYFVKPDGSTTNFKLLGAEQFSDQNRWGEMFPESYVRATSFSDGVMRFPDSNVRGA